MTAPEHFTTRVGDMWVVTCDCHRGRQWVSNIAQLAYDKWLEAHDEEGLL